MLVAEVVNSLGYTLIEATDSVAGTQILSSEAAIDVLVTDIGLPGGQSGLELVSCCRARRPQLKVLFITGYAENAAVGNGHLEPGMELLTKPFTMEALTTKVADMMSNGAQSILRIVPVPDPSSDEKAPERIVPFVEQFVKTVSLDQKLITLDWGLDF